MEPKSTRSSAGLQAPRCFSPCCTVCASVVTKHTQRRDLHLLTSVQQPAVKDCGTGRNISQTARWLRWKCGDKEMLEEQSRRAPRRDAPRACIVCGRSAGIHFWPVDYLQAIIPANTENKTSNCIFTGQNTPWHSVPSIAPIKEWAGKPNTNPYLSAKWLFTSAEMRIFSCFLKPRCVYQFFCFLFCSKFIS